MRKLFIAALTLLSISSSAAPESKVLGELVLP